MTEMMTEMPSDHARVLDLIKTAVARDGRFEGLAAGGSLLNGDLDDYSDLDLVVVVGDDHHSEVMERRREIAGSWMPLLAAFTGEHVGEPRLLICLCADPLLHVDLKFVSVDELDHRIENPLVIWERDHAVSRGIAETEPDPLSVDPQWIEDRFWIWVHYVATKLGRGELFEVLDFLGFLRGEALAPLAQHVRGRTPRGVRRFEQHAPDLVPLMAGTVAAYDWDACVAAVSRGIEIYRTLRGQVADPVRRCAAAEEASVAYLESVIADGPAPGSVV